MPNEDTPEVPDLRDQAFLLVVSRNLLEYTPEMWQEAIDSGELHHLFDCVGPFDSWDDASLYAMTNPSPQDREIMLPMGLFHPSLPNMAS